MANPGKNSGSGRMTVLFMYILILGVPASAAGGADRNAPGTAAGTVQKHTVLPPLNAESYEYYDLCGCCEKDLRCEMLEKAITWKDGVKYDSVTSWKVKWDYTYSTGSDACYADSFRVAIDVLFRLPRWTCDKPDSPALSAKWKAYIKNLLDHEHGHRDRALAAAQELTRAVEEMPPARTCPDLDRQLHALSSERMKKLDEEQSIYDAATNHGRIHECEFP